MTKRRKDKKTKRQKTKTKKRVKYCDVKAVSHSCKVFCYGNVDSCSDFCREIYCINIHSYVYMLNVGRGKVIRYLASGISLHPARLLPCLLAHDTITPYRAPTTLGSKMVSASVFSIQVKI